MSGMLDEQSLERWAAAMRELPLAPLAALAVFFVGGLVMLPVVLLIGAMGMIFGPWLGAVYALGGALSSALAAYGLGLVAGHYTLDRFSGGKAGRLSSELADHGVATIVVLRLLPVAPFTLINLVAGASRFRLGCFAVGTLLGMIPVVLAITVFAHRLGHIWREPDLEHFAVAGGALLALGLAVWLCRRLHTRARHPLA
ncbi:hypothetical protein FAK_11960 [Desulfoferula mesophila]|uniref:TVP38/TMEM64 family membrane protein n=2 Tax=Desulfoferula mesophila TaxID=3058419 RepID=A0AAU9EB70_9BACT|nr:hypothetical protein FAK_11960 [Desulfoferula mesophilus]